jgi:AbrB family looped-hinge helix DNA binding protein
MSENEAVTDSTIRAKTKVSANGRIVLPAPIRDAMHLNEGDTVILELDGDSLKIESFSRRLEKIQDEIIRVVGNERSLADELIAERRAEARRELGVGTQEPAGGRPKLKKAV